MVHNELSLRLGELAGHLSQCTLATPSGQLGTCRLLAQAAREMSVSHGVCMHTHTHTLSFHWWLAFTPNRNDLIGPCPPTPFLHITARLFYHPASAPPPTPP